MNKKTEGTGCRDAGKSLEQEPFIQWWQHTVHLVTAQVKSCDDAHIAAFYSTCYVKVRGVNNIFWKHLHPEWLWFSCFSHA